MSRSLSLALVAVNAVFLVCLLVVPVALAIALLPSIVAATYAASEPSKTLRVWSALLNLILLLAICSYAWVLSALAGRAELNSMLPLFAIAITPVLNLTFAAVSGGAASRAK